MQTVFLEISILSHIRMLQQTQFSDFILLAAEKKFHVHLYVLGSRCPSILVEYQDKITKSKSKKVLNQLEIEGIDPSALEQILKYIYSDIIALEDLPIRTVIFMYLGTIRFKITRLEVSSWLSTLD